MWAILQLLCLSSILVPVKVTAASAICKNIIPDLSYEYLARHSNNESNQRTLEYLLDGQFFNTFPRIYLHGFQGSRRREDVNQTGLGMLQRIAKINQNFSRYNLSQPIEVWTVYYQPETPSKEFVDFLEEINQLNSQSPGTVTKLLRAYDCAPSIDTLLVTKDDLNNMSQVMASAPIPIGLSLPIDVCNTNSRRLKALPLELIESLTFGVNDPEGYYLESGVMNSATVKLILQDFETCHGKLKQKLSETNTTLNFAINLRIRVNVSQGGTCESEWFTKYTNKLWMDKNITIFVQILQINEEIFPREEIQEHIIMEDNGIQDVKWIKDTISLSKHHIGFTIPLWNEENTHVSLFDFKEALEHENVLMEISDTILINGNGFGRVQKALAAISNHENVKPNIWLKINIERTLQDFSANMIEVLNKSIAPVNQGQGKGLKIQKVLLKPNWESETSHFAVTAEHIFRRLQRIGDLSSRPKFGIEIPVQFCLFLATHKEKDFWVDVDFVVLSYSLHINTFQDEDAKSLKNGAMFEFRTCLKQLDSILKENDHLGTQQVTYHVEIYGCQGKYTSIDEIASYGRFVQGVSEVADSFDELFFIKSAYEYSNELMQRNEISSTCVEPDNSRCSCGWWVVSENHWHKYMVQNKKSVARKLYKEKKESSMPMFGWMLVGSSAIVLLTLTAIYIVYWQIKYRLLHILSKQELTHFFNGNSSTNSENSTDGNMTAFSLKYNKVLYEIPSSSFQVDHTKPLGAGTFGSVYTGVICRNETRSVVAVKTIKDQDRSCQREHALALRGLLSEIKILSYIEAHENVIRLLGANTDKIKEGVVHVFLEFCELGSLESLLRKVEPFNGAAFEEVANPNDYTNGNVNDDLYNDLSRWALEIAIGMEYLASKCLVHADLAARNVLIHGNGTSKIADFGLSRRLYNYTSYLKKQQEPLPWRYMAPEALRKLEFNEKTDVWSYGVLLWEMYSLADKPYPGLEWSIEFSSMLEQGLRLNEPKYCVPNMYSVMQCCWEINPHQRPTFSQLVDMLSEQEYAL